MAKYSPTRMELLRLRKRIDLARRGHKLLEDKLEGLIKEFMPLVHEYAALRSDLDARLPKTLRLFQQTAVLTGQDALRYSLLQTGLNVQVDVTEERRSNVPVPALKPTIESAASFYSLLGTPETLDLALSRLKEALPRILKTAEVEEAVRRLAKEIERTRRRVNALEYVLIPRLLKAKKDIQAKLDEDERAARIRNMKVKELLEKASRSSP